MVELPRTEEGQVALPPTASEMGREAAEQTVHALMRMAEALERIEALARPDPDWPVSAESLLKTAGRIAHDNLDRYRAECAVETCMPACDQPTEAHWVECPCYQAGLEAQREPAGRGTP